jgi:uncharacterized MAPEG superfamily protein
MTIALWCVMVAAILPLVCTGIAKKGFENFDNRNPRSWLARQEGWRARANAAQQNSWEALMVFSAGVFAAHLSAGPQPRIDVLAMAFVAARVAYIFCYVTDRATLRSIVWSIGMVLSLSLFFVGA